MRTTGIVKWFNDTRGYGFITPDSGGGDCYVHHSAILGSGFRTLHVGERVEFEPDAEAKAHDVARLE